MCGTSVALLIVMLEMLLARAPFPLSAADVAVLLDCDEWDARQALEQAESTGSVTELDNGRYVVTRDM